MVYYLRQLQKQVIKMTKYGKRWNSMISLTLFPYFPSPERLPNGIIWMYYIIYIYYIMDILKCYICTPDSSLHNSKPTFNTWTSFCPNFDVLVTC